MPDKLSPEVVEYVRGLSGEALAHEILLAEGSLAGLDERDPGFVGMRTYLGALVAERDRRSEQTWRGTWRGMVAAGVVGGGVQVPLRERAVVRRAFGGDPVLDRPKMAPGRPERVNYLRSTWVGGTVAEDSFALGRLGGVLLQRPLNAPPWVKKGKQFRVFDFIDVFGTATSDKFSTRDPTGRFGYFDQGLRAALGLEHPAKFGRAAEALYGPRERAGLRDVLTPRGLSPADARLQALMQGRLAINADDVVAYRERIVDRITTMPGRNRPLIEALLEVEPITVQGTRYTTLGDIQTLPQAEQARILEQLARRAAQYVTSVGLTTDQGRRLIALRDAFGATPSGRVRAAVNPEMIMLEMSGAGWRGTLGGSGRAAYRGGAAGGVIGIVLDSGVILLYEGEFSAARFGRVGASGIGGGAVGAGAETAIAGELARRGFGGVLSQGLGRVAGGSVGAPVAVVIQMGLEDEDYTATDYAARGGRAAVAGGASAVIAWGITGAVFGSKVPIAGTIVGFVIGIGAYYFVDWLIGDTVEGGIRSALTDRPSIRVAGADRPPLPVFEPPGFVRSPGLGVFSEPTIADIRYLIAREQRGLRELNAWISRARDQLETFEDEQARQRGADFRPQIAEAGALLRELIDAASAAYGRMRAYERLIDEARSGQGGASSPLHSDAPDAKDEALANIARLRDRLRDLYRWLVEAGSGEESYRRNLEDLIRQTTDEFEGELRRAREIGLTEPETPEPLQPPPPPPAPDALITYTMPMERFVNRQTGEMRLYPAMSPPRDPDWERVVRDPGTGESNVYWGWVRIVDPATGRVIWVPGWKVGRPRAGPPAGSRTEGAFRSLRRDIELVMVQDWANLEVARRAGVDTTAVAGRRGLDLTALADQVRTAPTESLARIALTLSSAVGDATEQRRLTRGSAGWSPIAVFPGELLTELPANRKR
ncbi:MAG: hypothetical protein ACREU8_07910 [Gammaproteobacteria bacterium]